MEDTAVKRFSLKRKSIPLEVECEDGITRTYTLKELSGAGRDAYFDLSNKRGIAGASSAADLSKVKSFKGMYSDLLCLCVYDDKDKVVTENVIQSWPASTQAEMHRMALDLSGLTAKAQEEAKNGSQVTD